ncbi:MAG: hypothetical protein LBJ38_03910 [Oscillospiraceae bacterium]|nr:hypothetical protein [Oscillospiraceae bacterium]
MRGRGGDWVSTRFGVSGKLFFHTADSVAMNLRVWNVQLRTQVGFFVGKRRGQDLIFRESDAFDPAVVW